MPRLGGRLRAGGCFLFCLLCRPVRATGKWRERGRVREGMREGMGEGTNFVGRPEEHLLRRYTRRADCLEGVGRWTTLDEFMRKPRCPVSACSCIGEAGLDCEGEQHAQCTKRHLGEKRVDRQRREGGSKPGATGRKRELWGERRGIGKLGSNCIAGGKMRG